MRLVKVGQLAVTLVASGGAVLVLAGTSLAADATQVGVQADPSQPTTQATSSSQQSSSAAVTSPTVTSDTTGGTTNNTSSGGTVATKDSSAVTPAVTNKVDPAPSTDSVGTKGAAVLSDPKPVDSMGASAPGAAGNLAQTSGTTPVGPAVQSAGPTAKGKFVGALGSGAMAVAGGLGLLGIQPVISSHAMLARSEDLASELPSAPMPNRNPEPAKSSGAWGTLTVAMSHVVVPQPFMPFGGIIERSLVALGLLLFAIILITVFASSYGLWLRRGGYATAARSDIVALQTSTTIATPLLLLGYVRTPPRLHSPTFCGGRNQIVSRFVIPTLTERRITI